jgi:hypothetical protein
LASVSAIIVCAPLYATSPPITAALEFQRQPSAIESRLKKLALDLLRPPPKPPAAGTA